MDLDGIRVLDLTRLLPGPYGTQLLADAGADVIKVEEPGRGDYARTMSAMDEGPGIFPMVNRGKRSAAIDLKNDVGREVFLTLAEDADVVVEGFSPGVTDRLGIGYEEVRERAPQIVYCSLSGFGATGPHRDRAGHDLNYIGMAGLLDMTRDDPDAPPVIPGYPIADMAGGLFAMFAIVTALLSRELGDGTGEYVDVAMTDVVASFSQSVAGGAFTGADPRPGETPLTGGLPCYDVYEAADGEHVTLAALEPPFFEAFCEAVDRPSLVEHHLSPVPEIREELREELADVFERHTAAEWEELLGDVDAMTGPVLTPAEALESEHVEARGLVDRSGEFPRVAFPALFSGGMPGAEGDAPELGEHTDEVLAEAGFEPRDLEGIHRSGAISGRR